MKLGMAKDILLAANTEYPNEDRGTERAGGISSGSINNATGLF
jgi:hypothetical protein